MHIGNNNYHTNYTMNGSDFSKVINEKDFGITINNDIKPDKHCSDVVKKANKLVGFIGTTFEYISEKELSLSYSMHVYALI